MNTVGDYRGNVPSIITTPESDRLKVNRCPVESLTTRGATVQLNAPVLF